ncbi:MAG: UbiD family decarboxylase [Pirellulales bacterium]
MTYRSLRECVDDLAAAGHLRRIDAEVDPHLEIAAIHRRVFAAGGPALLFTNVKGCRFPVASNLFGTIDRARFIFRDALESVRRLIELKIDPTQAARRPFRYAAAARTALAMLPKRVNHGPVLTHETTVDKLPQIKCWPDDGGAFITLPQVYTEDVERPGLAHSNLGMYRVQLSGNDYAANRQIGLHYQIHRGIGVHHAHALRRGVPARVNIFVGGPPAMTVAAVMPLPEGMSELGFAGALNRRRVRMIRRGDELPIHAEADFCITGVIEEGLKREGPFGDHLGYYSMAHDFPVLRVERVYHREGAVWPFTVVGRPPQEDTIFGQLIHELTGPIIPTVMPGVKAVHAVDAAGVHPLLLAIGSERYMPFLPAARPAELLTQANAILGQGQLSLAKYLWIAAAQDDPNLDIHDVVAFFMHVLRRVDWRRDLHFQTATTIDTLDYSGTALNEGSKVVIAAVGPPIRELPTVVPGDLRLCDGFDDARLAMPGVLVVRGPRYAARARRDEPAADDASVVRFCAQLRENDAANEFPLVAIVDDADFASQSLGNFLWTTFTRSDPARDVHGVDAFVAHKHWGCRGSLVIDARAKPWHAPPLVEDSAVTRRVESLAAGNGPLAGLF